MQDCLFSVKFIFLATGGGYKGLFSDFDTMFWSGVLRVVYAIVTSAPFLVSGLVITGLLRGVIGPARIKRLLGVGKWYSPLSAWFVGLLIPICSFGALPVARELRRSGVPSGTIISFVMVAPILNPISIAYGISYIDPVILLYFGVGTFLVSSGIGLLWNYLICPDVDLGNQILNREPPLNNINRLLLTFDTSVKAFFGPMLIDYLLALTAVGLLGAFLPYGSMQTGFTRDNLFAPIVMSSVAIPMYITPMDVMMQFGQIARDGYSLGCAFVLIVLGAGANVGLANWLRREYGRRAVSYFVAMLITSTIVLGFITDKSIIHGKATIDDHTHAFDGLTRLDGVTAEEAGFIWVWEKVNSSINKHADSASAEIFGLILLTFMFFAGLVSVLKKDKGFITRIYDPPIRLTYYKASVFNKVLTYRQLVGVCSIGFCCMAAVCLFVYYPEPRTLIDEMGVIRVEIYDAVREEDLAEYKRRVSQFRRQASKMPMSIALRWKTSSQPAIEHLDDYNYVLTAVDDHMTGRKFEESKMIINYLETLFGKFSESFNQDRSDNNGSK